MREVISLRHPYLPVAHTFQSDQRCGSVQIDGAWATPDLPIERGTFLAFHKTPGDHRYVVLDIKWEILLGESVLKVERPQARRLTTGNPAAATKYRKLLKQHFVRHRLLPRLHMLYRHSGLPLSLPQQQELETIDRLKSDGMRYAEKHCRTLAMGQVDFSPPLDEARDLKNLWLAVVRKRQGKTASTTYIRRVARRLNILCPLSVTLEQAQLKSREAQAHYLQLKPQATKLRCDWLS